jgi:hypothetical protein
MLSWLLLSIKKLLLLHLVGCLYYCISDGRSHKHQNSRMRSVSFDRRSHFAREFHFTRRCLWQWPLSSGRNNLKKEAVDSSETPVYIYQSTRPHIPENDISCLSYKYLLFKAGLIIIICFQQWNNCNWNV